MRKALTATVLLLLCCVLCVGVCAMGINYTDSLSGMRFTLPDGWDDVQLEDRDITVAWFAGETEDIPAITFYAVDAYAMEAPENLEEALDWVPGSRIDHDNSKFPIEAFTKALGVDETELTRIVLKGREYFCVEAMLPEAGGTGLSAILLREKNGFCYAFRF